MSSLTDAINKLKEFGRIETEKESFLDQVQVNRARTLRKSERSNPDGSVSTVKFAHFEEEGIQKVIPTLFPKDPNVQGSSPDLWMEFSLDQIEEAKKVAEERGEVFTFDSQEKAEAFAKGAWKKESDPRLH